MLALILTILSGFEAGSVLAEHEKFRFKWPYRPGVFAPTTTLPGEGGHADGWDFDIGGGGVNGEVVSSAEGAVLYAAWQFDPNTCNPADGDGFGNHVKVLVPMPEPEPDITVTYAHFQSVSVTSGRVLQGDQMGIEGKTGHTIGSEPPGWPPGQNNCGTHLHFQFNPARPSHIDGLDVSGPPPGGSSTNSWIGTYNAPGAAIRQYYWDKGELGFGPSWGVVGWTADWTGDHVGCGAVPYCRLNVHYAPDAQVGHWGSAQTFRKHPGEVPVDDDNSIMAGRWAVDEAYWVQNPFFEAWLGDYMRTGLPITDQIAYFPGWCDPGNECVNYQRFHQGYIWEHETEGVQEPVFCPDVAPPLDWKVRVVDILFVVDHYGWDWSAPYEPWAGARADVYGDGEILVFDILAVQNAYFTDCYPPY